MKHFHSHLSFTWVASAMVLLVVLGLRTPAAASEDDCTSNATPTGLQVSLRILNPPNALGDIVIQDEHVEVEFVVTDTAAGTSSKKDQIRLINVANGEVLKAKKRGAPAFGTVALDAGADTTGTFRVDYLHKCSGSVITTAPGIVAILPDAEDGCGAVTCPKGPMGPQGPAGPAGPTGADGLDGATGPAGPAGATGPPGADGIDGATGPAGLHCWDLDANSSCDAAEDLNVDSQCDAADCRGADGAPGTVGPPGPAGADGANGTAGPQGPAGPPGVNCWDLNANSRCDTPTEDNNADGQCSAADCQVVGSAGTASFGCAGRNILGSGQRSRPSSPTAPALNALLSSNSPLQSRVLGGGGRPDQYNRSYGFTVDILPTLSSGETHQWESVRGGGICFNLSNDPTTGRPALPEWDDLVLSGPVSVPPPPGAATAAALTATPTAAAVAAPASPKVFTNHFVTDLSVDVVKISPIQVYFPAVAIASGGTLNYREFAPLPPVYPNIVFEFASHPNTHPDIISWVKSSYLGTASLRNISVRLWNVDPAGLVATYDLIDCSPVAYEEISLGIVAANGGVRRYSLEVACRNIIIDLADNTLDQWIADMQSGSAYLRDIALNVLDPAGAVIDSYDFFGSFLTGYSLPPLDVAEDSVEVVETVEIVPGHSDYLLQ